MALTSCWLHCFIAKKKTYIPEEINIQTSFYIKIIIQKNFYL